jgi:hypothetical protein
MTKFSERQGYNPKKALQFESIDDDLRNSIWNLLHEFFWSKYRQVRNYLADGLSFFPDQPLKSVVKVLWANFFKLPIDQLDTQFHNDWSKIKPVLS